MPVFHTKTIESILEPVAQQISKLVILQEESGNGSRMPDLSMPVQVVQKAADNLIKAGYETCETSDDLVLKKELPEALKRVEQACFSLNEASNILKTDPSSSLGKRTLISGERGIIQGVSSILLTFDESQVRKIVQVCKQVIEYLTITELIEKMDDLVNYIKNLSPILTKMTREVDLREKDLTHQAHRVLLKQHLEQVKNLTPSFISTLKMCLITQNMDTNQTHIRICVEKNKEYLIKRLSYEINEIIRILQLTTYDEDEWTSDDLTFMRQKLSNFEVKLKPALNWLSDQNGVCDENGEKSLRTALEDAISISNKLETSQADKIDSSCLNLKSMLHNFCVLTQEGKRKTNLATRTSNTINGQLLTLYELLKQSINSAQHYGLSRPALTMFGKLEQANKWFNNPALNDNGLGLKSARLILAEARDLEICKKDIEKRQEFENSCYECEFLIKNFNDLILNKNKKDELTVKNIGKQLQNSFNSLVNKITRALIHQVADEFLDLNFTIRKLVEFVIDPGQNGNLSEKFNKYSNEFINHSHKLCKTAQKLALSSTQTRNKQTIELINELTKRICELTPEVVNSAYIVLNFPNNPNCIENLKLMQEQWEKNMSKLQKLVDETLDCEKFIIECEKLIIKETYRTQSAIQEKNYSAIITNALNIAQRSNRIIQIAAQEADNSEDRLYVEEILVANDMLKKSLPPMIQSAKMLALDPSNKESYLIWASSNEKLIDSIAKVRESVSNSDDLSDRSSLVNLDETKISDLPDLNELKLAEDLNNNQLNMPKYRAVPVSRPTPLPDLIEENETEFPLPESNQPILMAAHDLHVNINQWQSNDNDMIAVAKRISVLMAKLSELVRGDNNSKKELISTAKQLADESFEISKIAKLLAQDCTDKRMKMNLLQVSERIPTIGTQLKILSTVKATMLGSQGSERIYVSKEDEEATEMLIINAQNLNASVKATVQAAKSASIKIKTDSGMKLRWVRKKSLVPTK